jgi:hypothetical protein
MRALTDMALVLQNWNWNRRSSDGRGKPFARSSKKNEEMFRKMKMKFTFAVPALVLAFAGFAFAGSYFTLADTTNLTGQKLKAGDYEVSIKKDQAAITTPDGKTIKVPVKVEQATTKFANTMALTKQANGGVDLVEIDLGGSTNRLLFGQ